MRNFLFTVASVFLLFASSSVAVADPYQDLQTNAQRFSDILSHDLADDAEERADLQLQARDEFFPESGSGSGRRGTGDADTSGPFVVFRLNDVPYALRDVPSTAWFAPYVRDVANLGIVSGYRNAEGIPTGVFGPARNVSIEELAKMAIEASGIDRGPEGVLPVNLLAQNSWSTSYIHAAEQNAFAVYADGTVDIARPATRGEVVMTILQAFGVEQRETVDGDVTFSDVTAATLFAPAILTALHDGIVAGFADATGNSTGLFGPELPVNRAEVSKIISMAVQVYGGE